MSDSDITDESILGKKMNYLSKCKSLLILCAGSTGMRHSQIKTDIDKADAEKSHFSDN